MLASTPFLLSVPSNPAAAAGASIAFDAVSSTTTVSGTTITWTHTPVGTPTAVAVGLQYFGGAPVISVTYGGAAMALAQSQTGTANVDLWGLANPPAGPQTVQITMTVVGAAVEAGAITVTGSNLSTAFDSSAKATGTSTTPSVAVTSATGELVVDVLGSFSGGTSFTPGGTLRWGPLSGGGDRGMGSTAPATGASTTMSWTLGGSAEWEICAASFKK